jgi:NAD-dependent SIR2 family protein deacetylase
MVSAELDTATTDGLHALADILMTGHFVLFITGAGLSVASGISTYRVDGASIWNNFIYECKLQSLRRLMCRGYSRKILGRP